MEAKGVSEVARSERGFLTAYRSTHGRPSDLQDYWIRRREGFIARHMAQVIGNDEKLFDERGKPTRRHLALVAWAYSPTSQRLK
jgi:hypothetical protein